MIINCLTCNTALHAERKLYCGEQKYLCLHCIKTTVALVDKLPALSALEGDCICTICNKRIPLSKAALYNGHHFCVYCTEISRDYIEEGPQERTARNRLFFGCELELTPGFRVSTRVLRPFDSHDDSIRYEILLVDHGVEGLMRSPIELALGQLIESEITGVFDGAICVMPLFDAILELSMESEKKKQQASNRGD